ncbi:tyrosine-type recombinase/integrase [Haloechinothrix sp. YIM 98757]|uniref:Tyrosine-type recombinase/integrase n=1 Tax=Haloechinothrix aidingensis TaxID=2752311 RepID=A0A838A9A4_9PSEU|nr:tyrosine-type recombinase/integrase [Haloechinothrix aidingensis]MBA0125547.1 tyrosine-type recombinase/integrase [Haloechinothrix aidingensis]
MARAKDSNQRARGSVETLPSGALRAKVYAGIDPISGKRHYLTRTVPAGPDAEDEVAKALTSLQNDVDEQRNPRTKATVSQLLDRYLNVTNVDPATMRGFMGYYKGHIKPLLGDTQVGKIDAHVLDSFYAELRRCRFHCDGRKRVDHWTGKRHECKPLAQSTIRRIHFLLSGAFKRAMRWGWITSNPATTAEPPPEPQPNPQPPTPQEAARILTEAGDDPDWATLIWLAMTTGARRGELCALHWRNVDLTTDTISVQRSIDQDGAEIREKDTKSHQHRRIALDPATTVVMTEHKTRCEERATTLGVTLDPDGYVFSLDPDGSTPMKPDTVTQRYRRLAERIGIATTFHKLRHYSATELIAAGVDARTVGGRLGHSGGGSTTLRTYSAWVAESDQRAASTLAGRMPARPSASVNPVERAKINPRAPYEKIAVAIRRHILDGTLQPGDPAPTQKEIAEKHHTSLGTANRVVELLKAWKLVDTSRGRRAVVLEQSDDTAAQGASSPEGEDLDQTSSDLLDLRLIRFGETVREFTAEADPTNPDELRRLLTNAARRHGGKDSNYGEYELEIRRAGSNEIVSCFAAE